MIGETLTYNTAATQPHQKPERPLKVKLTQAKKIVASGMSEAEAIERAKAETRNRLRVCTDSTNAGSIPCACA